LKNKTNGLFIKNIWIYTIIMNKYRFIVTIYLIVVLALHYYGVLNNYLKVILVLVAIFGNKLFKHKLENKLNIANDCKEMQCFNCKNIFHSESGNLMKYCKECLILKHNGLIKPEKLEFVTLKKCKNNLCEHAIVHATTPNITRSGKKFNSI
jgi:hypothetical protein